MSKFKRFLALAATILVLMSVLVVPVMAYTVVPEAGTRYQPLWNLTAVEVTYLSGQVALFDLPTDWFSNSQEIINLTIAYDDPNDDSNSLQLSNIMHGDISSSHSLRYAFMNFSSYNAVSMRFIFDDSLIPYTALRGDDYAISPMMIANDHITTDGRFNFAYGSFEKDSNTDSVIGRRYSSYGLTSIDNLYSGNDGPPNLEGDPVDTGFYCLTPNNSWIQFLSGFSPDLDKVGGLSGKYMHFYDMSCTVEMDGTLSGVNLYVPLIDSSLTTNYFDYISSVFPGYRIDTSTEGYSQLGDFLAGTLRGFINFQIMPGITVGDLFMCVIGISLVILFVKFFAGG